MATRWVLANAGFRPVLEAHAADYFEASGTEAKTQFLKDSVVPALNAVKSKMKFDPDNQEDLKRIKSWYKNNQGFLTGARPTVSKRKMIVDDGGKLFNERDAAKALFHERIRARAAELVLPGENSVARYQQATTDILKDLNEEEEEQLETYLAMINDPKKTWLYRPLKDFQIKSIRRKCVGFLSELRREYGIHATLFTSFGDEETLDDVCVATFEPELPAGTSSGWLDSASGNKAVETWRLYSTKLFGRAQDMGPLSLAQLPFRRNLDEERTGLPWILPVNKQGYAMLPEDWHPDWTSTDKKALIRAFITMRYRTFVGDPKARVPWSTIAKSKEPWVLEGCLPKDSALTDPSKMGRYAVDNLFQHWVERVQEGLTAFKFIFSDVEDRGKQRPADEEVDEVLISPLVANSPENKGPTPPPPRMPLKKRRHRSPHSPEPPAKRTRKSTAKGTRLRKAYVEVSMDKEDFTSAINAVEDVDSGPSTDDDQEDTNRGRKRAPKRPAGAEASGSTTRKMRPRKPVARIAQPNEDDGIADEGESGDDDDYYHSDRDVEASDSDSVVSMRRHKIPRPSNPDRMLTADLAKAINESLRDQSRKQGKPGSPSRRPNLFRGSLLPPEARRHRQPSPDARKRRQPSPDARKRRQPSLEPSLEYSPSTSRKGKEVPRRRIRKPEDPVPDASRQPSPSQMNVHFPSEEPAAEEPVAEEPVAEEPVAEEPAAEEPAAEEPVVGESEAEELEIQEKLEFHSPTPGNLFADPKLFYIDDDILEPSTMPTIDSPIEEAIKFTYLHPPLEVPLQHIHKYLMILCPDPHWRMMYKSFLKIPEQYMSFYTTSGLFDRIRQPAFGVDFRYRSEDPEWPGLSPIFPSLLDRFPEFLEDARAWATSEAVYVDDTTVDLGAAVDMIGLGMVARDLYFCLHPDGQVENIPPSVLHASVTEDHWNEFAEFLDDLEHVFRNTGDGTRQDTPSLDVVGMFDDGAPIPDPHVDEEAQEQNQQPEETQEGVPDQGTQKDLPDASEDRSGEKPAELSDGQLGEIANTDNNTSGDVAGGVANPGGPPDEVPIDHISEPGASQLPSPTVPQVELAPVGDKGKGPAKRKGAKVGGRKAQAKKGPAPKKEPAAKKDMPKPPAPPKKAPAPRATQRKGKKRESSAMDPESEDPTTMQPGDGPSETVKEPSRKRRKISDTPSAVVRVVKAPPEGASSRIRTRSYVGKKSRLSNSEVPTPKGGKGSKK